MKTIVKPLFLILLLSPLSGCVTTKRAQRLSDVAYSNGYHTGKIEGIRDADRRCSEHQEFVSPDRGPEK